MNGFSAQATEESTVCIQKPRESSEGFPTEESTIHDQKPRESSEGFPTGSGIENLRPAAARSSARHAVCRALMPGVLIGKVTSCDP